MYSRAIRVDNAVLAYDVQGQGSRALLLFHGAGQDRSVFANLPDGLTRTYRVYSFDLFFHGQSEWNEEDPVTKPRWAALMRQFLEDEQVGKLAVLGYSIGARFALATIESFPRQTTDCYLVAPDGLLSNPWFTIATGSVVGRSVFGHVMNHPKDLSRLFRLGSALRLIDPATLRFIEHQLDSSSKRQRIFKSWTGFRLLQLNLSALQRLLDSSGIRLIVFLATRDRLVPEQKVRTFLKRLKSAHLEIIDSNHRRVLNDALKRIAAS